MKAQHEIELKGRPSLTLIGDRRSQPRPPEPSPRPPPRTRVRDSDPTSEALLAAADLLLRTEGPEALTVRRIADAAGVSTMNVYSRFGGRDGVIDRLHSDGYRQLVSATGSVPETHDAVTDLTRVARAYRTFAIENPNHYRLMFQSATRGYSTPPTANVLTDIDRLQLGARVRRGQQLGQIVHIETDDAEKIAAGLWATWHGHVSLELEGIGAEFVNWPAMFARATQTAIDGLRPTTSHRPT